MYLVIGDFTYCPPCDLQHPVMDDWEDEDEYQRPVRVIVLECGHEQVEDIKRGTIRTEE